ERFARCWCQTPFGSQTPDVYLTAVFTGKVLRCLTREGCLTPGAYFWAACTGNVLWCLTPEGGLTPGAYSRAAYTGNVLWCLTPEGCLTPCRGTMFPDAFRWGLKVTAGARRQPAFDEVSISGAPAGIVPAHGQI